MDALPVADKPPPARQSFFVVLWALIALAVIAGIVWGVVGP